MREASKRLDKYDVIRHTFFVIVSFDDADTHQLFIERRNKRWANIANVALRKLDQLHAAISLQDMRVPPANHLEALKGDRKGQHSVKINDQYRVCFTWKSDGAHGVEITDYH